MKVRCNSCGHVGEEADFPKGRDFFQNQFISGCANKECAARQSPGGASMKMMGGSRPFEFVRDVEPHDLLAKVLHRADEAS